MGMVAVPQLTRAKLALRKKSSSGFEHMSCCRHLRKCLTISTNRFYIVDIV